MRRSAIIALVVLLLLAALAGILGLTGGRDREEGPPRPAATAPGGETPAGPPALPPEPPTAGPSAPKGEDAPGEAAAPPAPAPTTGTEEAAGSAGPPDREAPAEAPPAIRPNPRAPPPPRPGVRPAGGGSRPPFGPTGLWERFPPEIPRGRASIEVTVLDREGTPVPGADVYVGPPESAGDTAVSFGDLRKVGKTGADGKVVGSRLPEGSASAAANLGNLLNGPRGLDMSAAKKVLLVADQVAKAEVRLPLSLAELGSIRGRVLRADGRPLASVSASVGFSHARTKRNGTFELPFVPAGQQTLNLSRYGFRPHREEVEVVAGKTVEVEVSLDYTEAGSLVLRGTVVGPDGEPVGGATVYVIAKQGMGTGTVRTDEADEHGRFVMEGLPDRLAKVEVRIQASHHPDYRAGNLTFPDGLKTTEVQVQLPLRLVKLRLAVTDAATGEPLTRCRFQAFKPDRERAVASFSMRSEDGRYETWLEPGEHEFVIEAPDHETLRAPVDVGAGGGEYDYAAKLVATGEAAVEVVLTVLLTNSATGAPVETAKVSVLPEKEGPPLAGLEGYRPGGRFVLPVPSGRRRLSVTAEGYEPATTAVELDPERGEAEVEVELTPR